jgi:hypothetical protein
VRRIAKVLLMATAVIAIPVATAAGANASPNSDQVLAPSMHANMQIGGLRGEIDIEHCSVSERLTGELLGFDQSFSFTC